MKGRMDGKRCGNQSTTPAGDRCVLSPGALGRMVPVQQGRREPGGASDDMSLACGALPAKVSSETPVANEDHCSAQVATVTVVGGAEWTNGAVRS